MSESSTGAAAAEAVTDVAAAAGNWRRAGLAGAAIGVLAAGAAAGVAIERLTVGRGMRKKARLALDASGPYGSLRGMPGTAYADDGTELSYEVDEVEADSDQAARRRRLFGRRTPAPVTVVFSHGYCLSQDSWHFQRAALRGVVRAVYWDQRSHGRSARGVDQLERGAPVSIDQFGRDLKAVIDAAAPEGPLVLVGHSMGGMTTMALADHFPELIRERVVGVALVGTSSGQLGQVNFGLPVGGHERRAAGAARRPAGARLAGRAGGEGAAGHRGPLRRYHQAVLVLAQGRGPGHRAVRRADDRGDADRRGRGVLPGVRRARQDGGAQALRRPAGARPGRGQGPGHAQRAQRGHRPAAPDAELVLVPDAGHLVMLEHPEVVMDRLADLLVRAGAVPRPFARTPGVRTAQAPAADVEAPDVRSR